MGRIGCIHCEKSRRDFVTRTFALIAPVHPILHRVPCSYEMIPNATKHYERHQKHVFRVQWGGSGAFVAKNSDTSSCHELLYLFETFCPEFCKATEWSQMHPNGMKCTKISMEWIKWVRCEKFLRDFVARTFALVRPVLPRVS